jgi:transcriptional regulator with XRE-family HTH domain
MLATRLRIERKKRKWTQKYVGDIIGVSKTAVHDLETLKQNPSYSVLLNLEELFGLTHRELLAQINDNESFPPSS